MAKSKNFFKRKWNERQPLEQGAIIIGGAFITVALAKQVKKLFEKPLQAYNYNPAQDIPPHLLPYGTGTQTATVGVDPRPLVDEIASSIIGYNFQYYPEVVNRLADLSPTELQVAYNYWNQKYKPSAGGSLTQTISDEWAYGIWGDHYYQPAIDALTNSRLY
jgi:hypothetical protein